MKNHVDIFIIVNARGNNLRSAPRSTIRVECIGIPRIVLQGEDEGKRRKQRGKDAKVSRVDHEER